VDVGKAVHVGGGTTVAVSVGGIGVSVGMGEGVEVAGRVVALEQLASNNESRIEK
jgi:hypothetical protein